MAKIADAIVTVDVRAAWAVFADFVADPALWPSVARKVMHDITYDMSDHSHATDITQIVCEAIAKAIREAP